MAVISLPAVDPCWVPVPVEMALKAAGSVSGDAVVVWVALAARQLNGYTSVGMTDVCSETGLTVADAAAALLDLICNGWLWITPFAPGSRFWTYQLCDPWLTSDQATPEPS